MESSRRDLFNDMAERRPIMKNHRNTYDHRFGFTPKTGIAFSKSGFCFYCDPGIEIAILLTVVRKIVRENVDEVGVGGVEPILQGGSRHKSL